MALASAATAALLLAIYVGSGQLRHLDSALMGYLLASIVAWFGLSYRVAAFWSRPSAAFFGRILLASFSRPKSATHTATAGARDLVAQSFIRRRGVARWLAHMSLAWGTLIAFAVTLPLVWGWMRFEAVGERDYVALMAGIATLSFSADSVLGWLIFHVLSFTAVAVIGGCTYFLWLRWRQDATATLHVAPLLLLITVAVTGLLLIPAARSTLTWVFPAAQMIHQASVVALLVALPFSKLLHIFIRPLHIGVKSLRASNPPQASCRSCSTAIVPTAQLDAVRATLASRGLQFDHDLCPGCRRRNLARRHSALIPAEGWVNG